MHPLGPAAEAGESASDSEKSPSGQASLAPNRPRARGFRRWVSVGLGLLLLLSFLLPLVRTGLWDPYELETADLARRASIHLLTPSEVTDNGAAGIPTVEEVGHGELPLLTLAASIKLFGSHTWALRLPLLLWALLGLGALYQVCARLGSKRLAVFAVFVLSTSPLYFVHARTALGDIATMACSAVAFSGLMLALFDAALGTRGRLGWYLLALLALVGGFYCRGALLGVAVPSLSVGLLWLLIRLYRIESPLGASETAPVSQWLLLALGASALVVGLGAAGWGAWAAASATSDNYLMALGSQVVTEKQFATHDFIIHALGHGLFPWSGFIPLALGFALRAPRNNGVLDQRARAELALRQGLVLTSVLGVALQTALAPRIGLVPFVAPFALAGVAAVALVELDERPTGLMPLGMVTVALLVLFLEDFRNFPEKAFSAFGLKKATFPDGFKIPARRFVLASVAIAALGCVAVLVRQLVTETSAKELWTRFLGWRPVRWLANVGGPRARRAATALGYIIDRRGALLAGALSLAGLTLSLGYYPALGAQLSPVGAFESYAKLAKESEPLAVMGSRPGASFFTGESSQVFTSTQQASDWLLGGKTERRWLVSPTKELAALNARFRTGSKPPRNLPVLDARSSQALLLSNELLDGETSSNPLDKWLPNERPALRHPLQVELDRKLKVIGYEIRRKRNQTATDVLEGGEPLVFVIGYEVIGRVTGTWQTFIHIDGEGKRFNGDHDPLAGDYPLRHWQPGDVIIDEYDFELEPSFTPGQYQVYFGMFTGEKRMPVTTGQHSENRIDGGFVQVVEM